MTEAKSDDDLKNNNDISGEEEQDVNCPICLLPFTGQDIGTPESCDHEFCLCCIKEWAKTLNTCPFDRRVFHIIFARHSRGGRIFEKIQVEDRLLNEAGEFEEDEDPTYCEICGDSHGEDRMLLCDSCDNGYHMDCLTPPLDAIPEDDWFCPECGDVQRPQPSTSAAVDDRHRVLSIPRTLRNRRVYQRIAQILSDSQSESESEDEVEEVGSDGVNGVEGEGTDDMEEEGVDVVEESSDEDENTLYMLASSAPTTSKRSPTKRRKTSRKRRTASRRRKKTGTRKTRRKSTRRTKWSARKRRLMTARARKPSTRKRLAGKLCIAPPPVGRTLPIVVKDRRMALAVGNEGLSVFGDTDSGSRTISEIQSRNTQTKTSNSLCHSSSPDLLSSILDGQELLGKKSEDIEIQKDGQLKLKQPGKLRIHLKTTAISLPASPLVTSNSKATVKERAGSQELTKPSYSSHAIKPASLAPRGLTCSNSSPDLRCGSTLPINGKDLREKDAMLTGDKAVDAQTETQIVTDLDSDKDLDSVPVPTDLLTDLDSIPVPTDSLTDLDSIPVPTDLLTDLDRIPVPTDSLTDLDSIPVPTDSLTDIDLDSIPIPTNPLTDIDLDSIPVPANPPPDVDLDSIPLPSASNTKLYLESIPLPDSHTSKSTLAPSTAKNNSSKQANDSRNTSGSINSIITELTGYSKLTPAPQLVSVYPVSVKVEGRKIYDSRDKEEIIERFKKMVDGTPSSLDLEDGEIRDDDDEIYILTPPPQSPESVVVLSTDSEDERINRDKARRQRKSKRKRSRSQDSRDRRQRSWTPRDNSPRSRTSLNRSPSRRFSRTRSPRKRFPRNSSRVSPARTRRRTPVRERLGHQYTGRRPDRVRRSRTHSPIRRRNPSPSFRRQFRSRSPLHIDLRRSSSCNGHRNSQERSRRKRRSSSRQRSDRRRNDSTSSRNTRDRNISRDTSRDRDYNKQRRSRSSRSPVLRRHRSKSRSRTRSRTPSRLPQSVVVVGAQSSSMSLAAELEKTRSGTTQENRSGSRSSRTPSSPKSSQPHSPGKSKSSSSKKGKSKKSKVVTKKKKKKRPADEGKGSKTKKRKKKNRTKSSTSHSSSGAEDVVVNLVSDEDDEVVEMASAAASETHSNWGEDNSRQAASPRSEVSRSISAIDGMGSPEQEKSDAEHQNDTDDEKSAGAALEIDVNAEEEESLPAVNSDAGSVSDQVSDLEEEPDLTTRGQYDRKQTSQCPSPGVREGREDVTVSSTVIDQEEMDKQAELQALQVIELLKNEVAEPDVAPPAQPPKSVAQKPLVIDWLIQKLGSDSLATVSQTPPTYTPPTVKEPVSKEDSATTLAPSSSYSGMMVEDEELPSSATELSNKQLLDKMVGQERIADEVKIILKPYYCKNTINKEEYKLIMRNCVTKIYQKTQGRVNPVKVKDFVEKYVGTVISRRK